MNHTIQLTTEQFQALQSGQPITIEPPKPVITKWEPIGGNYRIQSDLTTLLNQSSRSFRLSGIEYPTQSQANSAAKQLRAYARQLAWLAENDDGWIADWSNEDQHKYYVYIVHNHNRVKIHKNYTDQTLGTIYMSKENAGKLAQLMNDGIVEF